MKANIILFATAGIRALAGEYRLQLKNLHLSHGVLTPPFNSDVTLYSVTLAHARDAIAITPELYQSFEEYHLDGSDYPRISIHYAGNEDAAAEPASVAVRKQIDLPDDKSSLKVEIRMTNPNDESLTRSYYVSITQSNQPLTMLKLLQGHDQWDNSVLIEPVVSEDSSMYTGYVHPDATSVSLTINCASQWVTLEGRTISNNAPVTVTRERDHHRQSLEIACGEGSAFGSVSVRRYMLALVADYPRAEIKPPKLVVDEVGVECIFDEKAELYRCPNPKSKSGTTRMTGWINPSMRYTIENSDKSVEVRLLDQTPTIPFTYQRGLDLVIVAGRETVVWPLDFNMPLGSSIMRSLGWMLSVLLLLLLVSLAVVLTFSNIFGLGSPWAASEIASAMTFLCQYFCFGNFLRGTSLLSDMTDALKWTTLFIPLPMHSKEVAVKAVMAASDSVHKAGDIHDIFNAYGCLFWCMAIFVFCFCMHLVAMFKLAVLEKNSTFPHRMLLGHWESKILHLLAFPATTGAAMILTTFNANPFWKGAAVATLGVLSLWVGSSFGLVQRAVRDRRVTWVWNASVREDGELEDASGFWSDVMCDQLATQPVNRSLFKDVFPWEWVSTVADVEPVNISPQLMGRGDDMESIQSAHTLYPAKAFRDGTNYPMAKNPKSVEVICTRSPGYFCPGQRLVAGLLRTHWLDMLFTFESLSKFHSEVTASSPDNFVVPLTVKTKQLQGPITNGRYCFFFDGVRIPFTRVMDILFKMTTGILLGVSLATKSMVLASACYFGIAAIAVSCLSYTIKTSPYSRKIENWLLYLMLAAVGFSAIGFGVSAAMEGRLTVFADIFLWFTAIVCLLLSAYSCMVTFSVFSAVSCAPLEETRFLEKLCNCAVTVSDHVKGWSVNMPAYVKDGAKDLKAECNFSGEGRVHVAMYPSAEEPSLEFDVEEIKLACRTGNLQRPHVVLYAPAPDSALCYRYINVLSKSDVSRDISSFLTKEHITRSCADVVGRQVEHQVASRGRDKTVFTVTVVPPRGETFVPARSLTKRSTSRRSQRSRSQRSSVEMERYS